MVQGYEAPCGGGYGRWPSLNHGRGKAGRGCSAMQGNSREGCAHPVGLACKQRASFASGEFKLSVIRQQMNREPQAGEAYIMMSKDRHTVRLYSYDKRSCRLYEQRFDKDYTFMKVSCEDDREVFSISWDDVVVLLGSPVVKTLRIK